MGLQCRHYTKIKEPIHISWWIFDFCQYHLFNINEWNIDFSLQLIDDTYWIFSSSIWAILMHKCAFPTKNLFLGIYGIFYKRSSFYFMDSAVMSFNRD